MVIENDTQALLTGALMAQMMKMSAEYGRNGVGIAITDVYPNIDDEGNYLNTIEVTFQSGTHLTVRVDVNTEVIKEEE